MKQTDCRKIPDRAVFEKFKAGLIGYLVAKDFRVSNVTRERVCFRVVKDIKREFVVVQGQRTVMPIQTSYKRIKKRERANSEEQILQKIHVDVRSRILGKGKFKKTPGNIELCCK